MTIRLSSALRTAMVTNFGLGYLLQGGAIQLYAGTQPASADAAPTGAILATITKDGLALPTTGAPGGGLQLEQGIDAGTLARRGNWILKGVAAGTFGWWRFAALNSPFAGASSTAFRLDGAAGDSFDPAEISAITEAMEASIPAFLLTLPANT